MTSLALPMPILNLSLAMLETDDMRLSAGRAEEIMSAHGLSSSDCTECDFPSPPGMLIGSE